MTQDGSLTSSLTWVARLVEPAALEEARRMTAALGLAVIVDQPGKLMARAPHGDVVEYLTKEHVGEGTPFSAQDTVVGFRVSSLELAVAALAEAGFPTLGDAHSEGGVRFQHVLGPAGVVYGLIQPLT